MQDRIRARNLLVARTGRTGLALTVLASALTGGVAGLLARTAQGEAAAAATPAVAPAPQPRRTIYVQIPGAAPVRAPAPAAPRRVQQAPVTRSGGS